VIPENRCHLGKRREAPPAGSAGGRSEQRCGRGEVVSGSLNTALPLDECFRSRQFRGERLKSPGIEDGQRH
jgi:hypothetical protein